MPGLPPLLETFLARWNAYDIEGVVALYTHDAKMADPTLSEPICGKQALRRYYSEMWATSPDARLECRWAEVSSSGIAWPWRFSGTAQNGRWEVVGASLFVLRDGLIARDHAVWDPPSTP